MRPISSGSIEVPVGFEGDASSTPRVRSFQAARTLAALSVSKVVFAPLSDALIDAYIASGQPFGKAGAYAIQSQLAGWIARIDGSHSAIMGLPLFETAQLLRQARVRF